jgi:hypothetical protein
MDRGSLRWLAWVWLATAAGCATAPPLDNPAPVRLAEEIENPVLVSPGRPTPEAYQEVFEKTIDVLDDYFELYPPNPYDGRIRTKPRIAPGFEQFWKAGNPEPRGRLLATLQSVRQTATARIWAGERGGYLVEVVVERELEDVPRPTQARRGSAAFQEAMNVDRQLEVVGSDVTGDQTWFKIGRDYALEQQILRRIRYCR